MTILTRDQVAKKRACADAATEGPWEDIGSEPYADVQGDGNFICGGIYEEGGLLIAMANPHDAPFLIAARTDVPALCASHEALRAALACEEAAHGRTIDEREVAERFLADAFAAVAGRRPEWSNLFGFPDAVNEIAETVEALRARAEAAEARVEALELALRVTLPMAKGYAVAHPVGSNDEYIALADEALAPSPKPPTPDEIDARIAAWSADPHDRQAHDALGWRLSAYDAWLEHRSDASRSVPARSLPPWPPEGRSS